MSSRAQDRLNLDLDRWRLMVDNDLDALEATAKKLVEADERQAARADRNSCRSISIRDTNVPGEHT